MSRYLRTEMLVLFMAASVAGTAVAQTLRVKLPSGVTSQMIFDGKEVFTGPGRCYQCHGSPPWGDTGPSLKDSLWLQMSGTYDELVALIGRGVPVEESQTHDSMPAVGGGVLTAYQVRSVAAYVWSVSRQKQFDPTLGIRLPPALPPGVTQPVIAEGKKIYAGRGLCYLCHGAVPVGGIGPDLTDTTWLGSEGRYEEIVSQVFSGTTQEDSKTGVAMPPRGGSKISDDEVRAVAAYIWAASNPDSQN